ncbi:hypothetical protein F5Y16DRAFT_362428 [Xylariaceae sp. FL0255]|nr:hypothetical protein F5Y16DRAFT_362428 [Xylariaceae sp. FL0255]
MSHPQAALTQRQFSPNQQPSSPSPNNATAPAYTLPAAKRPMGKPSPVPPLSQPGSPYTTTPAYGPSPPSTTSGAGTPTGLPSPIPPVNMTAASHVPQTHYAPAQQPNGRANSVGATHIQQTPVPVPPRPTLPVQTHVQNQVPLQPHSPSPNSTMAHTYSNATLTPITSAAPPPPPGIMGPPTIYPSSSFTGANDAARQAQRPATSKFSTYEVNDMLMGTGIDLDEEFDIQNNSDLETRTGFPHNAPGGRDSFYGSGFANSAAEHTSASSQEEFVCDNANRIWNEAARSLQATRVNELRNEFLEPGLLHRRLQDCALKYGLGLNLEIKPDGKTYMGRLLPPHEIPRPEIKAISRKTPDGMMVNTMGSFIPNYSFLSDQIMLLSIGTKEHMRGLLSDANKIAVTRQTTSHGLVPTDWADAAALSPPKANGIVEGNPRTGAESAVSPRTNPLKRPADEINEEIPNHLIDAVVGVGKGAQSIEESRLRKRLKRAEKAQNKEGDVDGGSRSGSVAPGTPGATAPDGGETKAMTKKEGKKAAAKAAENSSGTAVNATLSLFTGGKKKKYSWMTADSGSGASTPRGPSKSGGSLGSGAASGGKPGQGPLTKASVAHLGQFREDSEKGKNIQLRDWIVTLEDRCYDHRSLQQAYDRLDKSDQGDKVSTQKA